MAAALTPYMMQLLMRGIPIYRQPLGSLAGRVLPAATAWDAIKSQMNAPKAKVPNRADELIDPWSTPDPVAGALGIGVPRETLLGSKSVAAKVPTKGPTKAQQKIIDDAAKNYQSNSMPVLMQPQGPMKGGATMQPSINWGDANDAADFFRADALRRQMPGLLGWGGE